MTKALRIPDYLEHIDQAISKNFGYVADMDWETFSAHPLTQDATIRNLEIVGEAARNVLRADPQFMERYPEFQLAEAIGMRKMLIHGYHSVKLDYVWDTVRDDLPDLEGKIGHLLLQLRAADDPLGDGR